MALLDRPAFARLAEAAEDRLGVAIRPAARVAQLEVREAEFAEFRDEVEDLALHSLDYFSGRPQEMRPERRRRLAQRSRVAFLQDPLAGAEAQLLADFSFGKGVSKPTARNEHVQDVVDEIWTDANNEEKLFGYVAQRKLSNELITTGELFITMYEAGGRVRFGRLDPDLVDDIVPDPEDRLRPLWYVVRERRYEWDFDNDMPGFTDQQMAQGRIKKTYWKHWRNVDDAIKEREQAGVADDEQPLKLPPADRTAKGVVFHLPINQLGEQLRGNPPWARSLRFMTAMNVLTEAHVVMAQAASTFIARRAMRGTPNQITKAANQLLGSVSELGRASTGRGAGGGEEPMTRPFVDPSTQGPPAPGSWWNENESSKLEALNLQSGAGQMQQTAQIVRAPIAASSGFGQHYLGDMNDASLATASTLELPATMHVGSWQELFEQMYRWATDRGIEAAVKSGRLGGAEGFDGEVPLGEMHLHEAEDRARMEKRTEKDLSYEFSMPFPGRRQLPDVQAFAVGICEAFDPNGVNIPLRKMILKFVFEQMGIDDVARAVEEAIPDEGIPGGIGDLPDKSQEPPGAPGAIGPDGQPVQPQAGAQGTAGNPEQAPPAGQQPYGAKSQGTQLGESDPQVIAHGDGTDELFRKVVLDPALAISLGVGVNGHHS